MKKVILFIFICAALVASPTPNNNEISKNKFTQIEKEYIASHTLKFGMISDYYPFSFKENNKIDGFSYDYINLIMQKSGLRIQIEMDNWSHTLEKFKAKKIDMINGISYKKSRESFTNFSKSYFEISNVIFARKGELNNYSGFESLRGKKVGITKDIYYYNNIKSLGLFDLVEFKNSKDKMQALAYEKVDAIFNNLISGQKYIKRAGYINIKIIEELDSNIVKKEDLRIGIVRENKILFSIINKSMLNITREEKESLYNKWFAAKIESKQNENNINLTSEEKAYLKEKKQINMCTDPDWMPFEKIENGKHIGLAADYMKLVENSIDIPIILIKTKSWTESIQKAKQRECDIYSMASITKERKKYMKFTSPYLDTPIVIATKIKEQFIDNISQILDKKIGIVKGYSIATILKEKYSNINIVDVDSINDGLRQVESGKIFAFIDNLTTINYEIKKRFKDTIKVSGRLDTRIQCSIATRNDEPILNDIIDKVIVSIDANIKEKMFQKWVNFSKTETIVDYTLIWYILMAVSLLISVFIYRQYSLHKSNKDLQIAVANKTKDLQKLNESLGIKIKEEVEKNLCIQKKLFKSEKLAAMGEMIGNIAHQWRQPLSVISTGATGMMMQKEFGMLDDEQFMKICNTINENAQYLSRTIDDFQNFIKGDRSKKMFLLNSEINSFLQLVEGTIKKHDISVIQNMQDDIQIDGYENELTQCLINIFNNAKDALKDTTQSLEKRYIFIETSLEKQRVCISIKDNAGGIPKDIISHIFEPYFTTKHKTQGTGLGLHMTYNLIVDGMKGNIEANNISYEYEGVEYQGAEFIICIPIG